MNTFDGWKESHKQLLRTTEYDTYNGWQDRGRHVRKGEKHVSRNDANVALFHRSQTEQVRLRVLSYDPHAVHDENPPGNGDYPISAFDMGADF